MNFVSQLDMQAVRGGMQRLPAGALASSFWQSALQEGRSFASFMSRDAHGSPPAAGVVIVGVDAGAIAAGVAPGVATGVAGAVMLLGVAPGAAVGPGVMVALDVSVVTGAPGAVLGVDVVDVWDVGSAAGGEPPHAARNKAPTITMFLCMGPLVGLNAHPRQPSRKSHPPTVQPPGHRGLVTGTSA